ncbi:unnamed protein product, partial [Mycena citricolor]
HQLGQTWYWVLFCVSPVLATGRVPKFSLLFVDYGLPQVVESALADDRTPSISISPEMGLHS